MSKLLSGIELIAQERKEQIEKHGFTLEHDAEYNKLELLQAALYCINQATPQGYGLKNHIEWPSGWGERFKHKIQAKDEIGQLKAAGAFIAAHIDRLQNQNKQG